MALRLTRFDRIYWMTSEEDLWPVAEHLVDVPHIPLVQNGADQRFNRVDARLFAAGLVGRAD